MNRTVRTLLGLLTIGLVALTSCKKDQKEPHQNEGTTYVNVAISIPTGLRATPGKDDGDEYNTKGKWNGKDAIEDITVYVVDKIRPECQISGQQQAGAAERIALACAAGKNRFQFFFIVDFSVHDQGKGKVSFPKESRFMSQRNTMDMILGWFQLGCGQTGLGQAAMGGEISAGIIRTSVA